MAATLQQVEKVHFEHNLKERMGVDLVGEYVGPSCSIRATVGRGRGSCGLGEENLTWSWIRLADFCL